MEKHDTALREYLRLFAVFFRIGAVTFGGGLAMLPVLERELAEKRGWTTREQLLDYYAIGQSTPGIIAVNVATFIGCNRGGIPGGIVATAGIVAPSVITITILARFIENFSDIGWVRKALAGINVAVAALLTKAVWQFARQSVRSVWSALVMAAAFVLIFFLDAGGAAVIAAAALAGIAAFLLGKRRGKGKGAEEEAE